MKPERKKTVLVCGGAGYIGSHVVLQLFRSGYTPIIADNFANSYQTVTTRLTQLMGVNTVFFDIDLRDKPAVFDLFRQVQPDAVIQLAGLKSVDGSVEDPVKYYSVNIGITVNILDAMTEFNCEKIVFSSSATVYGAQNKLQIDESHPVAPINPYGRSKQFQEAIIEDWVRAAAIKKRAVVLRYFNPVGADPSGVIGEDPIGAPSNLMPVFAEAAFGARDIMTIFGDNYDTRDGTCERDYIHVSDLADAHVAALKCDTLEVFEVFNVGTGRGVTVREAIETYSFCLGRPLPYRIGPPRKGDAPSSVASNEKIIRNLDWTPVFSFEDACRDDLRWRHYRIFLSE